MYSRGFAVNNAGLVLLQAWYPMLFSRLGLVEGQGFASGSARSRAALALQFVASGRENAPEIELPLNKVLCGLELDAELEDAAPLSEHDRRICNDMIAAAVAHWPVIKGSSVDGFRANWLARPGFFRETDERWELGVEQRNYDILIGRSPFSFWHIQYQWMAKPVGVTWPI